MQMINMNFTFQQALEQKAKYQFKSNQGLAFGPYLLGYAVDGFVFGLLSLQVLQWYTMSYKTEKKTIRILVWWTFLSSTAYTIMTARWMLNLFAYGFDIYKNFYNFSWVSTFFLLDALIQTPISSFFAHRAYVLADKPRWFVWTICPMLILSFSTCIALKAKAPLIATDTLPERNPLTTGLLISWLSLTVITDMIVTTTICWSLLNSKLGIKGFERTDKLIKKVIIISIEAQVAPTIFSFFFMVAFTAVPRWNLSAFFMCTPKVYAIALLGVLNARQFLNRDLAPQPSFHISRPIFPRLASYTSAISARLRPGNSQHSLERFELTNATQTEIHVQTETIQQTYLLQPLPIKRSVNRDPLDDTETDISSYNSTPVEEREEIILGNTANDLIPIANRQNQITRKRAKSLVPQDS